MAWTTRAYSKKQVDDAGVKLRHLSLDDPHRDNVLTIIGNWRSCHAYPLHAVKMLLKTRAITQVNEDAVIAQRLKRLSSIALKLEHNATMRLTQMQDIGGCRAVLGSIAAIRRLEYIYDAAQAKNPHRSNVLWKDDYITHPKGDGYRSLHLIINFRSDDKPAYNGQRIEIQLRSKRQHAWATAVETCQVFTGQALKTRLKAANPRWLRFFALMSSAIAARERAASVPDTPTQRRERIRELRDIDSSENIVSRLAGWNRAIMHPPLVAPNAAAFLLELNAPQRTLRIKTYTHQALPRAQEEYLEREREAGDRPGVQVVLVSTDSVRAIRKAYPNYYMDTTYFMRMVSEELSHGSTV